MAITWQRRCAGMLLSTLPLLLLAGRPAVGDRSLREAVAARPLTTAMTPWELLHGLLVHGGDATLRDAAESNVIHRAAAYICMQRIVATRAGRRASIVLTNGAPRFITTYGEANIQGHPWQFTAKLLAVGVPLDQPIRLEEDRATLRDMLDGLVAAIDTTALAGPVPLDGGEAYRAFELSWILEALAHAPPDAAGGVDVDALVRIALTRPLGWGACGGTHELMALALWQQPVRGDRLTPDTRARLRRHLDQARRAAAAAQHAQGYYTFPWTERDYEAADLARWPPLFRRVYATGHMLAWMTLAAPDAALSDAALRRAYRYLDGLRVPEELVPVYYGPCTHAIEALRLYETASSGIGVKPWRLRDGGSRGPAALGFGEARATP